jgi:hypothetical protein
MIIKVDTKTFIEFNPDTKQAVVIDKPTIQADLADAKLRLREVKLPTEKELLGWARQNYPYEDNSVEQVYVKEVIAKNQAILDNIKAM